MNIIISLLNHVTNGLYSFVGDWGIVIILATIIIRICMLPLSLKQRKSVFQQQEFSKKVEDIKLKYGDDMEKQKEEVARVSAESMKSMLGCIVTLIQIPVMYCLYKVFSVMPVEVGSIVVPWISNLKLPDAYHVVPLMAVFVQLLPNIIATYTPMKAARDKGLSWTQLLIMGGFSMMFFIKAPVTLGIYWITSGLFNTFEMILYNRFMRRAE